MVEGPGADEIAPVGSPEGEAHLVRSTEQRSWAGGCNGGRSCPLAKMRGITRAHLASRTNGDVAEPAVGAFGVVGCEQNYSGT